MIDNIQKHIEKFDVLNGFSNALSGKRCCRRRKKLLQSHCFEKNFADGTFYQGKQSKHMLISIIKLCADWKYELECLVFPNKDAVCNLNRIKLFQIMRLQNQSTKRKIYNQWIAGQKKETDLDVPDRFKNVLIGTKCFVVSNAPVNVLPGTIELVIL